MAAEDYILRFTDPARSDGELLGSTFIIKPFTVNGPQHPIVDVNFTDPETGNATGRQSPIVFYGKGIPEYGEQMANNLLQVAENFAGSSAPTITTTAGGPLPGVTWFQDEKYWVDTVGEDIFVWNDDTDAWVNVTATASWSTNAPGFDIAANRAVVFPAPVTGDYFYATDTGELSVFFIWSDFTPAITAWLTRISNNVGFAPTVELPRRTLSVFDPTTGQEDFVKLVSYKGNDIDDPMTGPLYLSADPIDNEEAANKNYVDTEIAAAIGGSNELFQLLDVDSSLDASTGNTPPPADGQVLIFDTGLAGGGFDGLWTAATLVAANISDFAAAADAQIALAIIDDLSDVNVTNGPGIDGFALVYNDGASEWQATATAATDTFLEYNNEPGPISPYSVASSTGLLTMNRNDAQPITVDNITPLSDYTEHINGPYPATDHVSLLAHDADVVDWTDGALSIGGTPGNVEEAINLLDAAIVGAAGTGYTQFGTLVGDPNSTGASTAGNGEGTANLLNLRSGNNRLTIAISDNDGANNDNVLYTINEANIVHDNLSGFDSNDHIDHTTVGMNVEGIIVSQDETDYPGGGSPAGDFAGGTGHAVADVITLSDGSTVTVDVEAAGVITGFTISTVSGVTAIAGVTITQSSTTGSGITFSITPELDNLTADTGLTGGGNYAVTISPSVDILGTTSEVTVTGASDLFLMWDASAGALRSVLGTNLPGAGGASAYSSLTTSGAFASGSASAGVADTLNFRSANNLLSVVISEPGTDDIFFTINEANLAFGSLVDDGSPQLGNDLDVNGSDIISVSNGDINILPNGSGTVQLDQLNISNATVQTTDATVTSLQVITIPADTERMIVSRAHCNEPATDDSAWFFSRFGVKNVGGTVSLLGGVSQDTGADAGASTWTVTVDVTGATVRIRVTGEAAHTINWETTTEVS